MIFGRCPHPPRNRCLLRWSCVTELGRVGLLVHVDRVTTMPLVPACRHRLGHQPWACALPRQRAEQAPARRVLGGSSLARGCGAGALPAASSTPRCPGALPARWPVRALGRRGGVGVPGGRPRWGGGGRRFFGPDAAPVNTPERLASRGPAGLGGALGQPGGDGPHGGSAGIAPVASSPRFPVTMAVSGPIGTLQRRELELCSSPAAAGRRVPPSQLECRRAFLSYAMDCRDGIDHHRASWVSTRHREGFTTPVSREPLAQQTLVS
jgi:hypothetical protein